MPHSIPLDSPGRRAYTSYFMIILIYHVAVARSTSFHSISWKNIHLIECTWNCWTVDKVFEFPKWSIKDCGNYRHSNLTAILSAINLEWLLIDIIRSQITAENDNFTHSTMKLNIKTKIKPYQIKKNNRFTSLRIDEITKNEDGNLNDEPKDEKPPTSCTWNIRT